MISVNIFIVIFWKNTVDECGKSTIIDTVVMYILEMNMDKTDN